MENAKYVAEFLKTLANENRLLIFCGLMEHPMTVTEIATRVPKITSSALSQHLAILKAHGLLGSDKKGLNVTYSIIDQRVIEIITVLKKHFCQ